LKWDEKEEKFGFDLRTIDSDPFSSRLEALGPCLWRVNEEEKRKKRH